MNLKIESSNSDFTTIISIILIVFITFTISNSIVLTLTALVLSIALYYREKVNGIFFTDNNITILDGIFFKRKLVYSYEQLHKLKIKQVYSTTVYSEVITLYFEKDFKYVYPTTMTYEIMEIKKFVRSKGIFVDDDSES